MSDTESDSLESQTAYDGEEVESQEEEEKIAATFRDVS